MMTAVILSQALAESDLGNITKGVTYTQEALRALGKAQEVLYRRSDTVDSLSVLWGVMSFDHMREVLQLTGIDWVPNSYVDPQNWLRRLIEHDRPGSYQPGVQPEPPSFDHSEALSILRKAEEVCLLSGDRNVKPEHLLLGVLAVPDCSAAKLLSALEITGECVGTALDTLRKELPLPNIPSAPQSSLVRTTLSGPISQIVRGIDAAYHQR